MVDSDDPCRLVSRLVDLLDVSPLVSRLGLQGGASYHPRVMLKLAMFAAWDGERSSRKVEKRCKTDVRYRWLMGGLVPDHTTIWHFRHALGPLLDDLLAECVSLGKKAGLGGLSRASIDGTKLPCAASQWRRYREEADLADEELAERELRKEEKKKGEPLPCKDPQARTMRSRQGRFVTGYNAQALVDADTDLVAAFHLSSEASDAALLEPTLANCLESCGELPGELLADAGYDTPMNAWALHETGVQGWVACKERVPFWVSDESGRPLCPAGYAASHPERFTRKGVKVVRLSVGECGGCPLRRTCLKKEDQASKSISFDARVSPEPWIRQKLRSKSEAGKATLKERGSSVEFAFARLKARLGFHRFSHWGLRNCRVEVGIHFLAMNLAILGARLGPEELERLRRTSSRRLSAWKRAFRTHENHGRWSNAS